MKDRESISVNVGDLVYNKRQLTRGLSVVVAVDPAIQLSEVREETDGENGLRLSVACTSEPVGVVGSIPIPELAQSMVQCSEVYQILGYDYVLKSLHASASKGPATIILDK